MFFFIGLTMATIQGTYARRISPGGEIAAVKRVWGAPGGGGGWSPELCWKQQEWGLRSIVSRYRPSCCWSPPSSSSAGGARCLCWAWGCCSTRSVSGPARARGRGGAGGQIPPGHEPSPLWGDGASLMSPISCRCRGALSVLRGRRLR